MEWPDRVDLGNAAAALAALVLASLLVQAVARAPERAPPSVAGGRDQAPRDEPVLVHGADGRAVPAGDYRRIASLSYVADGILAELIDPARLIAVTEAHRARHPQAFRSAHAAALPYGADLEAILPYAPDLILVSDSQGSPGLVARARELGYTVVDLGPMQGRRTLLPNIRRLGRLLGVGDRGERLAEQLASRLDRLPLAIASDDRITGLYAAAYGSEIYGGTLGSSYHDVLVAAGIDDVAADAFPGQGWPRLRVEDILRLAPQVIVTHHGGRERLRALPVLAEQPLRIVEVDGALLGDPSLLLPAAEAVQRAVYGVPAATSP